VALIDDQCVRVARRRIDCYRLEEHWVKFRSTRHFDRVQDRVSRRGLATSLRIPSSVTTHYNFFTEILSSKRRLCHGSRRRCPVERDEIAFSFSLLLGR
jgi:hypothetical protein